MIEFVQLPWVQRAIFAVGGVLVGYLVERRVIARARRLAESTRFRWDDLLLRTLRGLPTIWAGLAGVYLALTVDGFEPGAWITTTLTIVLISSLALAGMRLAGGAVEIISAQAMGAVQSPTLVVNVARALVASLAVVLVLQNLGIDITPIVTALGIGGLAVALALQDTLGNLFAGMQIILSRQVRTGDFVRLSSGEEGRVTDVKGRNTTIELIDGNLVAVPNSVLASSIVKNFTLPTAGLWLVVDVGVSYESDLDHVQRVTIEVATQVLASVEGGCSDEAPVMLYRAFGESSIDFIVRLPVTEYSRQGPIRHEFIKRLHKRFGEEGIEIPFPIRTVIHKPVT